MSKRVYTNFTIELEVGLEANLIAGQAQTHDEPGHDAYLEDMDIAALTFEGNVRVAGVWQRKKFNILAGLDAAARNTLITNLIEAIGEDAENELLEEGAE